MAVPDYQSMMLPLLTFACDGNDHRTAEAVEALTALLGLTDEDLDLRTETGSVVFVNRLEWAKTYLKKAGLIQLTGRARFRITARGSAFLREQPARITVKDLTARFPEFAEEMRALRARPRRTTGSDVPATVAEAVEDSGQTPEEQLQAAHVAMHRQLATDLLEQVKAMTPRFFEQLVIDLLVAMGYGGSWKDAAEAVGRSGDGGIDGIIKEDKLGLDAVYIQAKRWEGAVGRPAVQAFAGALSGNKASKGVLLTTSTFTNEAREFVGRLGSRIVLVDGERLAELMIEHNVGVSEVRRYAVHRIDADYFTEE